MGKDVIRLHKFIANTTAEGPGTRACIWTQGCLRICPGCLSESTWDINGGYEESVEDVIDKIFEQRFNIEGLTILGGEPFLQTEQIKEILKRTKELRLNTMVFTGYLLEELIMNEKHKETLRYIDLLVDGPFEKDKYDISRPWVGSSNQRFIAMSEDMKSIEEILTQSKNKIELHFGKDGKIELNGMGNFKSILGILKDAGIGDMLDIGQEE